MTVDAPRNVADLVRRSAGRAPAATALVSRDERVSWGDLDGRVDRVAAALRDRLGLAPGDRVALLLPNDVAFAVTYFAALRAGLVVVPVNTGYTAVEVAHVLDDCQVSALVAGRAGLELAEQAAAAATSTPALVVVGLDPAQDDPAAGRHAFDALLATGLPAGTDRAPAPTGGEDLAVVLYTSGTSGRPRGAMLTHRALLANLEQGAALQPPVITADDVVLLVLPLFHVYGLNAGLGAVAFHGATGLLAERFEPSETLELVRRHEVTTVLGAPPVYVAWSMLPDVGDALTSVRVLLSGAAPLPVSVQQRVLEVTGHHVFEGYGLTETAPVLTSTLVSEVAKAGSIGQPLDGVELRLVDERGRPVEDGDPGEIVVRGANLFSGYWPDGVEGPDADGWWGTGDVAYADEDGDLHLVDRRRELILVSGFNVYPREVEDVLVRHDDVVEAAVLGMPHPYTGEAVRALVVRREGSRLTPDELVAFAARSLARFKCPATVEFVDELPHSATGKVSKGRLRELSA